MWVLTAIITIKPMGKFIEIA